MVTAKKLTDESILKEAAEITVNRDIKNIDLDRWYLSEHSPIRTQIFWILMQDIPTYVSTHLTRHKIGVEHFVKSNREDRGGELANRLTPVNHGMLINAQALITMSRKRLCNGADKLTRKTMEEIKEVINGLDSDLAKNMVKECEYRGKCTEILSCKTKKHGKM